MKVTVTSDCIACGLCVEICPEVFALDGSIATVKMDKVPEEYRDACDESAESCPVEAIKIED